MHRTVRLRLLPETRTKAQQLAGTAGACRWVWNRFLARQQFRWQCWQDYRIGPKPAVSAYDLFGEFTALRRQPEYSWLQEYSCAEVRHALKYLADAYRKFFVGQGGHPRFKARHRTVDGCTIPGPVSVSATQRRVRPGPPWSGTSARASASIPASTRCGCGSPSAAREAPLRRGRTSPIIKSVCGSPSGKAADRQIPVGVSVLYSMRIGTAQMPRSSPSREW